MPERIQSASIELISAQSPSLNEVSDKIHRGEIQSQATQWLIDQMLEIANGIRGDEDKKAMAGLAAPQVGVNKRIIIVDTIAEPNKIQTPYLQVFINPIIVSESTEQEVGREGCFSTDNIRGIVERASKVMVHAVDRNNNDIEQEYAGFTARIFQHEIDHLNGIRFPDRITEDVNLHWVEEGKYGKYRDTWQEWDVKCPRATWEALKQTKASPE